MKIKLNAPWRHKDADGKFLNSPWRAENDAAEDCGWVPIMDSNNTVLALAVEEGRGEESLQRTGALIAAIPEFITLLEAVDRANGIGEIPLCVMGSTRADADWNSIMSLVHKIEEKLKGI